MKSTRKHPVRMLAAIFLAVVMLLGVTAGQTVEAANAFPIPVIKQGSEVTAEINLLGDAGVQIPPEVLDIVDNLTFHVTQMTDMTGDTPQNYFNLDVAREGNVGLTVSALMGESGDVVVDIPQLFDTTLTIKVEDLIGELFGEALDQQGMPSLEALQNLNFENLAGTITGITEIFNQNAPEGVAADPQSYTVETLSAELVPTLYTYEEALIEKIVDETLEFLKTDPGFVQVFDLIIKPMNAQNEEMAGKTIEAFIDQLKADAKGNFAGKSIEATTLSDAAGETRGFHVKLISEGNADVEVVLVSLAEDKKTESELLLLDSRPELIRLLLLSDVDANNLTNGTFSIKTHESKDKASATTDIAVGTFNNIQSVPFGAAMMTLGNVEFTIQPEPSNPQTLTLIYNMESVEGAEDEYKGNVAIKDIAEVALGIKEIAADNVVIPAAELTGKETQTIASMTELQALFTQDLQVKLMSVLQSLGFSFEMEPPTTTTTP